MLIDKLEIISFGKFKNKTIEFSNGLNVIVGNNESGKSTVIAFIYAMLYGFGDNRGKGLSIREKYIPWGGDCCEGKILATLSNGRKVTIYRKSGNVKKYDVFRVFDTTTGEEIITTPEDLVGVSGETFLKTLCIRQMSTVFDGSNSEIVTRLSNISQGGDESVSYEKAIKIIENCKREIQPLRGSGGKLAKLNEEIAVLERACHDFQRNKAELDSATALLPALTKKAEDLKKEYDAISSVDFSTPIARLQGRIEERSLQSGSKKSPLGITAVLLLLVSAVLLFVMPMASVPFLILSAVTFAVYKRNKKPSEDTLGNLEKELSDLTLKRDTHEKKISAAKEKLREAEAMLSNLNNRIISLSATADGDCLEKLSSIKNERQQLEKELQILSAASRALINAHEKMQKNFTPILNKKASEYFYKLTGGKYNGIFCDEDFGIKVQADLPRESGYFSGGTVDQLYLSLRLALIDMLYGDENIPVILDEPFLQYDDGRMENTVALFKNLESKRQFILFSNARISFSETEMLT